MPDPSLSLKKPIRKHNAGVVKLGFSITASQLSGEKELKAVSKSLEEKKLMPGLLVAHVFLAQDLIPADANGSSDPYYKISFYGQEARGETVMKSLNPVTLFTNSKIYFFFSKGLVQNSLYASNGLP